MAHFHDNALIGASGQGGYQIERSLRFNSADSAYLNRTPASAGNRTTWTLSMWVKRSKITSGGGANLMSLFGWQSGGSGQSGIIGYSSSTDTLSLAQVATTYRITNAVFRDVSAWAHLVFVWDSNNATDAQRCRIYVNGSEATYSTSLSIASGTQLDANSTVAHGLGADIVNVSGAARDFFDGYLTEIHFIDGQALTPSSFGETDTITGVWKPKKYSGTYGTNGFYLKFADNSGTTSTTLGKDSSGNGNNWTPNNFSVTAGAGNDSMIDTPTPYADGGNGRGNYCTLNPLDSGTQSGVVDGNLVYYYANISAWITAGGTIAVNQGKWYWEATASNIGASSDAIVGIGAASDYYGGANYYAGQGATNYGYFSLTGNKLNNNTGTTYGATYTNNDVIGVALDMNAGTVTFYKNNVSQGVAFSGLTGLYKPIVSSKSGILALNFGQRAFAYTPPSGFLALNTQNLPEPSIKKPSSYFDIKLYSGTNANQSITGLGFSPDLIWFKNRTGTAFHGWFDSVRGRAAGISSNVTDAESTSSAGNDLVSFDANGFSLGPVQNWNSTNGSGNSIVAWCWDESATPGFDIVTWTGDGTASRNISHSLGVAPKMIISKTRTIAGGDAGYWDVYHASLAAQNTLFLHTTGAATSAPTVWPSAPTSTVFTVGNGSGVNVSGSTYVAYLWSEVAGFSKFGSYTGNGSADGPFVYCGFRPRWIMFKNTSASSDWLIFDTARDAYNLTQARLFADLSNAESSGDGVDALSNGFKVKNAGGLSNSSGNTYIFAAFAETAFRYSLAR